MGHRQALGWLGEPAERTNETILKLDAIDQFREMVRRWHEEMVDSQRQCDEWKRCRAEHIVRLKQEPQLRDRDKVPAEVEQSDEYWTFIEGFEYEKDGDGNIQAISGWVPVELLHEPHTGPPLPLTERVLSMPERYAIAAAIHDVVLPIDPIDPWKDSPPWWELDDKTNIPTFAYCLLKHAAREFRETDRLSVKVIVDAVLDDLHKTMNRRSLVQDSFEPDKVRENGARADDRTARRSADGAGVPSSPEAQGEPATVHRIQKYEWLARAMFLVKEHPAWSDRKIAREVKKDHSTLLRSPEFQTAAAMARGQKTDILRGFKDSKTGEMDAYEP